MTGRRRIWLILLLTCVAVAPGAPGVDLEAPAWAELVEEAFEAVPVETAPSDAPARVSPVRELGGGAPSRLAAADIFRPPIG